MSTNNNQTSEQDLKDAVQADNETVEQEVDNVQAEGSASEGEAELDELRKQADENLQRYLRVQADFDNFRRRARLEKEDFAKYASLKVIEQLLPVMDNFERALSSSKETKDFDALAKGLDMTYRQLDNVLEQEGLKAIEAVGQPFNPEYHQAIMQVESEEHVEGIILEELQKGYLLKDKVIRPAMVKVSV
ncbi:heat shock protein GrpE [compost metagenome]